MSAFGDETAALHGALPKQAGPRRQETGW